MDNAVALVQAYLRVNGYFTVSEYPVLEARRSEGYRTATDLDVLAVRFPGAGMLVPARKRGRDEEHAVVDPALGVPSERADMLVGEVKEGHAVLNAAATDPAVLRAALVRFGCCPRRDAPDVVERLLHEGRAMLPAGHHVRLVAFGSLVEGDNGAPFLRIALGQVVHFLQRYLRDHWEVLRQAESKDPAFGFLMMMEKAIRGHPAGVASAAAAPMKAAGAT